MPSGAQITDRPTERRQAALGRRRRRRRVSRLPADKRFDSFDESLLPNSLTEPLRQLRRHSAWVERGINVLAIGPSASGKTHACCALGHALIDAGHAVRFVPASTLIDELLAAQRQLALGRALRRLDAYRLIVIDDLGAIAHNVEQAEVLWALVTERYGWRSLVISSRWPLHQWQRVFHSRLRTAAALDRLVHHAVLLPFEQVPRSCPARRSPSALGDERR